MAPEIDTAAQPDLADTPQPAKKTPAKRARRKHTAPADAAVSAQDGAGQSEHEAGPADARATDAIPAGASVASPADEGAAPRATTTRRRSTTAGTSGRRPRSAAKAAAKVGADGAALMDTADGPMVDGSVADGSVADASVAVEVDDQDTPAFSDTSGVSAAAQPAFVTPSFGLLFQAPQVAAEVHSPAPAQASDDHDGSELPASVDGSSAADEDADADGAPRRRRRGGRGRRSRVADGVGAEGGDEARADIPAGGGTPTEPERTGEPAEDDAEDGSASSRRRRRRRRGASAGESEDAPGVVTKVREARRDANEVTGVKGSTRLEAKKQRRREGREAGRRRTVITEAEFLARRESVDRVMLVRQTGDRTQIGVLEDGVLVEHYVSRDSAVSMAGNIYLGRVQNVLPSMEAAFVDIGKGRNAVLYAGEVNWDAAGLESNQPKRIENALSSGENVLVQVTKDPIGHKGARLTSQISLPGRYLVYVPDSSMTGISRKLPDTERSRLKGILKDVLPETAGVIVRTAAEGASEEELRGDVERLTSTWDAIKAKAEAKAGKGRSGAAPLLLHGEPDLTVRVIRDIFNEDFSSLIVSGDTAFAQVNDYVHNVAPDLVPRIQHWTSEGDLFSTHRVHEQIAKAMDRKVWLPSGGSLVIDRTEAMTVIDVNTGKFVGSGGNLEETVTKNNLEAAEEIVRQLRLRDVGGIIVIDFIDMVLESNRELVVRRLLECLGRDRTKHQVAEVTSLGLVQMTRKRVGSGLLEVFSEPCDHCKGRGLIVHTEPVDRPSGSSEEPAAAPSPRQRGRRNRPEPAAVPAAPAGGPTPAQIAAAAHAAAVKSAGQPGEVDVDGAAEVDGRESADSIAMAVDSADVSGAPEVSELAALGDPAAVSDPGIGAATAVEATAVEATVEATVAIPVEVTDVSTDAALPPSTPGAPRRGGRRRRGRVVAPAGPPRPAGQTPDN